MKYKSALNLRIWFLELQDALGPLYCSALYEGVFSFPVGHYSTHYSYPSLAVPAYVVCVLIVNEFAISCITPAICCRMLWARTAKRTSPVKERLYFSPYVIIITPPPRWRSSWIKPLLRVNELIPSRILMSLSSWESAALPLFVENNNKWARKQLLHARTTAQVTHAIRTL